MQEELLSRRVLIFIAGQVYWKCKWSYIDEKLNWGDQDSIVEKDTSIGSLYYALLNFEPAGFLEFSTMLEYYMSKQLSFQDALLFDLAVCSVEPQAMSYRAMETSTVSR